MNLQFNAPQFLAISTTTLLAACGSLEDDFGDVVANAEVASVARTCTIDGTQYDAGTPQSGNPCRACLPSVSRTEWSSDSDNVTCSGEGFWDAASGNVATTALGHKAALQAHNAYGYDRAHYGQYTNTTSETLRIVHEAISAGADLVEIDIHDVGGRPYVKHSSSDPNTVKLETIVSDRTFFESDASLVLEFKSSAKATDSFVSYVLRLARTYGFAKPGRLLVLRNLASAEDYLKVARTLLASELVDMRPYVRLALIPETDGMSIDEEQDELRSIWKKGYHAVALGTTHSNVMSLATYAHDLGLGVELGYNTTHVDDDGNIGRFSEMHIAALREEVDWFCLDGDPSTDRRYIEADNSIVYMNAYGQDLSDDRLDWTWRGFLELGRTINTSSTPKAYTWDKGEDLYGNVLHFDGDNDAYPFGAQSVGNGYFATVVANLDALPGRDEVEVLLSNADSGGFTIELANPTDSGVVLRCGMFIDGEYRYAWRPASDLSLTNSYVIACGYDGKGRVRLLVNGSEENVTPSSEFTKPVTSSSAPITLGADPQGWSSARYFFRGKIQMASVQSWGD